MLNVSVSPRVFNVGVGQPYDLRVVINNTGISDDPFVISAFGLPAWNVSDVVIAQHGIVSTFVYPVFVTTPGVYNFTMSVASKTSFLITKKFALSMTAQASLLNDYASVGQGVVLAPIIYEPAYSVMLLLKYIVSAITNTQ